MSFSESDNHVLDAIMIARRSVRRFSPEVPPRNSIEKILEAGRIAPYSGAMAGVKDFRHFFVIPSPGAAIEEIKAIVLDKLRTQVAEIEPKLERHPELKAFHKRWSGQLAHGPRGVGNAPWFVVFAERKGFPPSEAQSLAFCAQNMWLKATALGLGYQYVSHIRNVGGDDPRLCALLGISPGEYGLGACSIGYPAQEEAFRDKPRQEPELSARWLQ